MFLSLNWLKDFLTIPKGVKPEDIAAKLTMHTVEVEGMQHQADRFANVVVGKVLEVAKHPNADRLNVTKVDVGAKEPLGIVCGAPNVAKDQLVAVALVGCELPNGMKIEEREVRGEKSCGMICAADELGLGDDHSGIMVLDPKKAKIGKPFAEYLGLEDIVFEVDNKSLTNRPDLWGHLGMARELATLLDSKTTKEFDRVWNDRLGEGEGEELDIKVEEGKLCPRYMAAKISGVSVKDSPSQIKERLIAAGMRPINNVVDATNYVMLELGQPLHAFDASLVEKIIVRRAKQGEVIKTLDGQERKLVDSMLVIADKERPLAIAGVMGGENSGVSEGTSSIILEAANFQAPSIRKTSIDLALRSESSVRFEKSLDPNLPEVAMARFLDVLKQTCPEADIQGKVADIKDFADKKTVLSIDLTWVAKRIGQDFGKKHIVKVLESLGFLVKSAGNHPLEVEVPSFRSKDVKIKEDILEEIVRVHGYDNVAYEAPLVPMAAPEPNLERAFERKVKNALAFGARLTEVLNYSFLNEDKMAKLKMTAKGLIKLANPISNLHTHLRGDLFPNMLDNVRYNQAKYEKISIFEIGSVFSDSIGDIKKTEKEGEYLPHQEKRLCIMEAGVSGKKSFSDVKGDFEYLMSHFGLPVRFEPIEGKPAEWVADGAYAQILSGSTQLGFVALAETGYGLKKETAVLEISFSKLFSLFSALAPKSYVRPNKYPALARDLAFVVDSKALYNNIKDEIESFDPLISQVELFDVYEGSNLPSGMKSLAFHIEYESADRTLEASEVDALQSKLIEHLENRFDAKIRNF